ncbi:MAG: hypothetical protein A3G23_00380 [Bacteroidetes bacterium RIFCSPLOWO2_12_FULL_37_12]|nr:MAG: hypothetical protein A3G23_00380 [Bacteroidetes bacterium RIFCSPLOWO2_12_FULL_37_12]
MKNLTQISEECRKQAFDLNYFGAKKWKSAQKGRVLVGYLPIYFPREIVEAMNGIAVGILGVGDQKQVIKGDAFYQSYICHLPRGVIELALDNNFNDFDGFIFPSICDCVRNLSGMFRITKTGKFSKYLDFPQNFNPLTGGVFYRQELGSVQQEICRINGVLPSVKILNEKIEKYNQNRRFIENIYAIRQEFPWRLSAVDWYCIQRAGLMMTVEEHNAILSDVQTLLEENQGEPLDNIRVVVSGSFCEQPPLGLIKSIEMAGCYIVDDDFILGSRWIQGDIDSKSNDPMNAIVNAYLTQSTFSSALYDVGNPKGARLVELVKNRKADGVIFCAASFCDPALLDRPEMQKSCDEAGIHHINFQFHENTGQFKVIKEQCGTFSDSIKLWA